MYPHPRPWHGGSVLDAGPRRPLSYGQREQYRRLLDTAARGRSIGAMAERVGRQLVELLGKDGRLDPSYATLARLAGCCEKTARTAVQDLIALGLLRKVTRVVRAGWRLSRHTNAYELLLPAAATVEAAAPAPKSARTVQCQSKLNKLGFHGSRYRRCEIRAGGRACPPGGAPGRGAGCRSTVLKTRGVTVAI